MNPIRVYIYGVPDGFNLLSGTAREIEYYQRFYNTQRTGEDLLIDRRGNGECIYSYLRYGLVSSKGREGAFFGLSLVFTAGDYLKDVPELRKLFSLIYAQLVLGDDKLIKPMPNAEGSFRVSKFADEEALCARIERNLIANVQRSLATSVETWTYPIDKTKVGRLLPLPLDADSALLERAFGEGYTQLRLSSSFEPAVSKEGERQTQDLLSPEWIEERSQGVSRYKDFIIRMLKGEVSMEQVHSKQGEIKDNLDTLVRYQRFQPELNGLAREYDKLEGELSEYIRGKSSATVSPSPLSASSSLAPISAPTDMATHLGRPLRYKQRWLGVVLVVLLVLGGGLGYYFMGRDSRRQAEGATASLQESAAVEAEDHPSETSREQVFDNKTREIREYIKSSAYTEAEERIQSLARDYPEPQYQPRKDSLIRELEVQFGQEIVGAESWSKQDLESKVAQLESVSRQAFYLKDFAQRQLQTLRHHLVGKQPRPDTDANKEAERAKPEQRKGLYRASDEYIASGKPLGTSISCKKKDHFVFYGSPLPETGTREDGVEVVLLDQGGGVKIRVAKSGRITLKMGGMTYTFNVKQ